MLLRGVHAPRPGTGLRNYCRLTTVVHRTDSPLSGL